MCFCDKHIIRTFATGIAGLSVVTDAFSAIKNAKVKVIRDETGLAVDYEIDGDYVAFGNDDDEVDKVACDITEIFMNNIRKQTAELKAEVGGEGQLLNKLESQPLHG